MKFLFRHKKWIPCMILIISFPLFTFSAAAYSEKEIIQKLQTFSMPQSNIISFCIRGVLWLIADLLRKTLDMLEHIVFSVNSGLNDIFKFQSVIDLENKIKDLTLVLFVLMLAYLAFEYMIKKQNINQHITNLLIGCLVWAAVPWAIGQLYTLSSDAIKYINDTSASMADQIVSQNTTDILLYDDFSKSIEKLKEDNPEYQQHGFNHFWRPNKEGVPTFDENIVSGLNPTEVVNIENDKDDKSISDSGKQVYSKCLAYDKNGNPKLVDAKPCVVLGINFDMLSNLHYRWNFNWLEMILTLLASIFALAISLVKIIRLIYELIVHQMMAQALAFLDIQSGQRLKKCLQSLIASFATLFGCFLFLQLFIAGTNFVTGHTFFQDNPVLNAATRAICIIAMSISVMDGPNLFEQIIGVDAGLNNTTAAILGAHGIMAGARALGRGVKGLGHAATGAVSGAKKAAGMAGKAGGSAAGYFAGKKAAADGMNALPFAQQEEQQSEGSNKEGADDEKKEYLSDKDKDKNTAKDKEAAEKPKLKETVGRRAPKTLGDHVKSYAKEKIAGENTAIGQAKRSYNLSKEAALHSANKKSYIANKTKELKEQNVSHPKREAKKDYKDKMDKHFGG